jgi:hypothetical protein
MFSESVQGLEYCPSMHPLPRSSSISFITMAVVFGVICVTNVHWMPTS